MMTSAYWVLVLTLIGPGNETMTTTVVTDLTEKACHAMGRAHIEAHRVNSVIPRRDFYTCTYARQ